MTGFGVLVLLAVLVVVAVLYHCREICDIAKPGAEIGMAAASGAIPLAQVKKASPKKPAKKKQVKSQKPKAKVAAKSQQDFLNPYAKPPKAPKAPNKAKAKAKT